MDGERTNDRLAEDVYESKVIVKLAQHTVNLISSTFLHGKENKICSRLGTVTCPDHRRVDAEVRAKILAVDDEGLVLAPQHVWLGILREKAAESDLEPELDRAIQAASGVLEGAPLGTLVSTVQAVGSDEVVRGRAFGVAGERQRGRRED